MAAGVIQRISAVSRVLRCRTGMVYDDQISILIIGKGIVSRSAEFIIKISAGQYRIGHFGPVRSISQIRVRIRSHQAYAVFRAGGCR